MKKSVAFLLWIAMLFSLAGCGVTQNQASQTTQPSQTIILEETTAPTEQTQQPADHEHTYTAAVTAPTCTDEGFTTYTCACGDSYVGDKAAASGHSFGDWVTTVAPTETATGRAEQKCSACNAVESRTLGKLLVNHTHSYATKEIKKATCTAEGERSYTCSCGESYTEKIAKTAHDYEEKITPASCRGTGQKTATCTRCGDSYTEKLAKIPHEYAAATCTQAKACKSCGQISGNPLGHSYGADGLCKRCGNEDSTRPGGPVTYNVTVRSDKGKLISGVTVTVYIGDVKVGSGVTDNKGATQIALSASGSSYKIVLSNVPEAYKAKDSYTFSSTTVSINLTTVPVLDPNDHSQALYTTGSTMANFVLTDVDGNTYDLSKLRQQKKLIILDFWYVNCNPCKSEFPYFEAMLKQFDDDVILLGLNNIDSEDNIRKLRQELEQDPATKVTFPMIKDTLGITQGFGVSSYPVTVFIDPDGKVVYVHKDAFNSEADFINQVKKYLK